MSDYDDDSDSCPISVNRMEMSNERIKRLLASRYGYRMCQHDRREGVIAFEKRDGWYVFEAPEARKNANVSKRYWQG